MKFALAVCLALATISFADEPAKKKPSISDQKSGLTFKVSDDDKTITAVDTKTGKAVWKTNVIEAGGKPNVGQPVIRDLSIKDDVLTAIYGKHNFAKFDVKTGRLMEKGSD